MELTWTLSIYTALLVLVGAIRVAELLLSRRNRGRMRAQGAREVREPHFAAMVMVHLGILAGAALEAWLARRPVLPLLSATMLVLLWGAIALRWWTIRSLGAHWNVAIMDSIDEGGRGRLTVATGGPFRWIRHPNYLAVFGELLALPLLHSAWISAGVGTMAHVWVLYHRVRTEERVLLASPSYRVTMGHKPRFVPLPLSKVVRTLRAFVRLGRPLFLVGGTTMYGLGVTVALVEGARWNAWVSAVGLVAITGFQLMTHYANEYFDYEADRRNATATRWTGEVGFCRGVSCRAGVLCWARACQPRWVSWPSGGSGLASPRRFCGRCPWSSWPWPGSTALRPCACTRPGGASWIAPWW